MTSSAPIETDRFLTNRCSRLMRATEIDTRMIGMIGALALIWIGFHI